MGKGIFLMNYGKPEPKSFTTLFLWMEFGVAVSSGAIFDTSKKVTNYSCEAESNQIPSLHVHRDKGVEVSG